MTVSSLSRTEVTMAVLMMVIRRMMIGRIVMVVMVDMDAIVAGVLRDVSEVFLAVFCFWL